MQFLDIGLRRRMTIKRPGHQSSSHISPLDEAENRLISAVGRLRSGRPAQQIVADIKATMNVVLPPHGFTVLQTLCERERAKVFNNRAARRFPELQAAYVQVLADAAAMNGVPRRKAKRLANNTWKWDHAVDRRARQGLESPSKGRPEVYDPEVVYAFADTLARATGRERCSTGHHGDVTITDAGKASPIMNVLVCAIEWAVLASWTVARSTGSPRPKVRPEGILSVLKRRYHRTN